MRASTGAKLAGTVSGLALTDPLYLGRGGVNMDAQCRRVHSDTRLLVDEFIDTTYDTFGDLHIKCEPGGCSPQKTNSQH